MAFSLDDIFVFGDFYFSWMIFFNFLRNRWDCMGEGVDVGEGFCLSFRIGRGRVQGAQRPAAGVSEQRHAKHLFDVHTRPSPTPPISQQS